MSKVLTAFPPHPLSFHYYYYYYYYYYYHHHHHHNHHHYHHHHHPREYSVAVILLLLIMVLLSLVSVLNLLYFHISTFGSMCAVPKMAVFWSSLTSCFPDILLTYFLNDFEIVPVAPIITGITFVLHSTCAVFLLYGLYILESSRLLF